MPSKNPKDNRCCKKKIRRVTRRCIKRWLRSCKECNETPSQRCHRLTSFFNCETFPNSRFEANFTANYVCERRHSYIESENDDNERGNAEIESCNDDNERENDGSARLNGDNESVYEVSSAYDDSESDADDRPIDNIDIDSLSFASSNFDIVSDNVGIDSDNFDVESDMFNSMNGSESVPSVSTSVDTMTYYDIAPDSDNDGIGGLIDLTVTDDEDDRAIDLALMDEAQPNIDTIQFTFIDIHAIRNVPIRNRWHGWMQTPTHFHNLTQSEINIQERELVRHYLNALPIEVAEDVGDDEHANVCSICTVKRATRAMAPCGHYVCADCMTHMVTHRASFGGVARARSCGICQTAVGFFLRVY